MKEYRKAETEFQEYLDAMLVAQGADAEDGKAPKMLSAAALVKVGYLRRILGRAKVPSAAAWIVRQIQAGEPPVVFAEHQDVIEALCTTLDKAKVSYVRLDGTVGRKARQQAIDRFQDGDVSVFIGSQAAREGITLTRARHALFIERWWTPAAEEQAEDRIRRIGQKYPTFVWFMSVPGTYDDRMSEIIESKRILVKRAIGSHDVQRLDATELLGEWLRGQPDADLSMPSFPTLPHGAKVHALVFDARNWTADTVRRWCRMHDYAPLSVEASDTKIRVVIRQKVEYVPGSFRGIDLGPDFGAILGTPRAVRKVTRNRNKAPRIVRI
jgi:hypothetical protein